MASEMAKRGRDVILEMRSAVARHLRHQVQELRRLFEAFFGRRLHISDLCRGGGYRVCAVGQPARPVQMLPKVLTKEIQQIVAPRDSAIAQDDLRLHHGFEILPLERHKACVSRGRDLAGTVGGLIGCGGGASLVYSHGAFPFLVMLDVTIRLGHSTCSMVELRRSVERTESVGRVARWRVTVARPVSADVAQATIKPALNSLKSPSRMGGVWAY